MGTETLARRRIVKATRSLNQSREMPISAFLFSEEENVMYKKSLSFHALMLSRKSSLPPSVFQLHDSWFLLCEGVNTRGDPEAQKHLSPPQFYTSVNKSMYEFFVVESCITLCLGTCQKYTPQTISNPREFYFSRHRNSAFSKTYFPMKIWPVRQKKSSNFDKNLLLLLHFLRGRLCHSIVSKTHH